MTGEQPVGEVPVVDRALAAQLVAGARENGLLGQLTKLLLQSALEGEITDHLGYEPHERGGSTEGNSRNGTRAKTVLTKAGPVTTEVPRHRAGPFEPGIVKERQCRLGSVEEMVLSLPARGLTHGEFSAHLAEVYGAEVSKTTISTITDKVFEGMAAAGGLTGRRAARARPQGARPGTGHHRGCPVAGLLLGVHGRSVRLPRRPGPPLEFSPIWCLG